MLIPSKAAIAAVIVGFVVCFSGGCSSSGRDYYKVRDPQTGRVFYTKDMDRHKNGAVTLVDGASQQQITLQNSNVQPITKDMFYADRKSSGQNPEQVREAEAKAAAARADEARAAKERAVAEQAAADKAAQARSAEARAAEERASADRAALEKAAAADAERARAADAQVAEAKVAAAKNPADAAPVPDNVGVAPAAAGAMGQRAASTEQFRKDLVAAKDEIDRTITTLSDLIDPKQTDLAAANKRFAEQVDALGTHAQKVKTEADAMKSAREAYFSKWDARIAAIDNPTLRTEAEGKRARLRSSQEKILVDSALVKEAYRPFMADLDDTRKFLADDASKDSVSVLSPAVKKAQKDGKLVNERIDQLIADLDEVEGKAAAPAKAPQ